MNKKGKADESGKKRTRRTQKFQKAIVGMSLDDIKKKILDDMLAKGQITMEQFIEKVAVLMEENVEAVCCSSCRRVKFD